MVSMCDYDSRCRAYGLRFPSRHGFPLQSLETQLDREGFRPGRTHGHLAHSCRSGLLVFGYSGGAERWEGDVLLATWSTFYFWMTRGGGAGFSAADVKGESTDPGFLALTEEGTLGGGCGG